MRGNATDERARALLAGLATTDDADLEALVAAADGEPVPRAAPRRARASEPPPPEGRVFMRGELQPGLSSDLIQLFAHNRETGRLAIEWSGGRAALYLADGQIVDARCGEEVGERAFFQLMRIQEGRFTYQRGVTTASVRIVRQTQHLIMDTLRLIDEAGGAAAVPPPGLAERRR